MTGARNGRIGMRLIDAHKLEKEFKRIYNCSPTNCQSLDWGTIKNTIRDSPEVDPVKHAHWVRVARSESEYWQCSNCHGYFTLPMPKYRGFYMRYCGCCGAEMDEVTE